jgi:hypothetical protein
MIKIHINPTIHNSKKIHPTTGVWGPWEGLGIETPLPSIHSLAQTMKNKLHLRRNK